MIFSDKPHIKAAELIPLIKERMSKGWELFVLNHPHAPKIQPRILRTQVKFEEGRITVSYNHEFKSSFAIGDKYDWNEWNVEEDGSFRAFCEEGGMLAFIMIKCKIK